MTVSFLCQMHRIFGFKITIILKLAKAIFRFVCSKIFFEPYNMFSDKTLDKTWQEYFNRNSMIKLKTIYRSRQYYQSKVLHNAEVT